MKLFQKKHKIAEDNYLRLLVYVDDMTGALTNLGCDVHDAHAEPIEKNFNYIEQDCTELNCLFEKIKSIVEGIR